MQVVKTELQINWGSVVFGSICAAVSFATLYWPVLVGSKSLTVNDLYIIGALACALGGGHYAVKTWLLGQKPLTFAFGIVGFVGVTVCAVISAGRGAEYLAKNSANVEHAVSQRSDHKVLVDTAKAEVDRLERLTKDAETRASETLKLVPDACQGGRGPKCLKAEETAKNTKIEFTKRDDELKGAKANYWKLVKEAGNFKPQAPANVEIVTIAKLQAIFTGGDEKNIISGWELAFPVLLGFLSEIGCVVFFHYGFSERRVVVFQEDAVVQPKVIEKVQLPDIPQRTPDEELVLQALQKAARPWVTNKELAQLAGISEGEASKRRKVAEAAGLIKVEPLGKHLKISLVQS